MATSPTTALIRRMSFRQLARAVKAANLRSISLEEYLDDRLRAAQGRAIVARLSDAHARRETHFAALQGQTLVEWVETRLDAIANGAPPLPMRSVRPS